VRLALSYKQFQEDEVDSGEEGDAGPMSSTGTAFASADPCLLSGATFLPLGLAGGLHRSGWHSLQGWGRGGLQQERSPAAAAAHPCVPCRTA
jgi:hypothetical protein